MDTLVDRPWTVERFLAWEDRQEGKHEFDGRDIIPMTGGSFAHQRIAFNLMVCLLRQIEPTTLEAVQEMRIRCGTRVRYPDVVVCPRPDTQTIKTLTDALAIFEELSDDTATTDRIDKLIDYAELPSLRCYVLLEQTAIAATVLQREPGGPWVASAHTGGVLTLTGLDLAVPLADLYRGLTFPG